MCHLAGSFDLGTLGATPVQLPPDTPRLRFRELSLDDLDFVAAMLADPEVMRYYPKCYSRDEAVQWIGRQLDRYRDHGHGLWLVLDRSAGHAIGQVGLCQQTVDGTPEPEVGYLVHRPFWRRGYATEAATAVRNFAFSVLNRPRVISLIRPENTPSQGIARKLGMQIEKQTLHSGLTHLVFAVCRHATSA